MLHLFPNPSAQKPAEMSWIIGFGTVSVDSCESARPTFKNTAECSGECPGDPARSRRLNINHDFENMLQIEADTDYIRVFFLISVSITSRASDEFARLLSQVQQ